jgi:hypothetical protein
MATLSSKETIFAACVVQQLNQRKEVRHDSNDFTSERSEELSELQKIASDTIEEQERMKEER